MKDIYTNSGLKYQLNDNEYKNIDKVWELINIFNKPFICITDYRNYLIKKIKKKYTVEEFYFLESIINKLFWNLRWLMFPLFVKPKLNNEEYDAFVSNNYDDYKEIPDSLLLCNKISYDGEDDLDKKLKSISLNSDTYYRSFINKLIIVDKVSKVIFNKKMEGSSEIFSKNFFNLYTMTVLLDRKLYEKIMGDPYVAKSMHIELSSYYYEYDYGFPNLNYCTYSFGDEEYRINRVKNMYYKGSADYWYKLF